MNKSDKNISFINNIFLHNIKIYYYQILGIKEKCEKIYYDLCSILLNDSYKDYLYDASFIISYDKSIFYNKINKNNEPIFISFFPNKNNLIIINILPQHGYPNSNENILFQFHIKYYTCIDDYLHMRILTWNCTTSNKSKEIFDSYDQDTLFRISLFNIIYDSSIENNVDINIINKIFIINNNSLIIKIEKILKEKLVNTIIKYRKEVKKEKDFKMIIIPSKIRNFILYYYSFFKQIISREKFLFNSLFNEKIEIFIKNIYPNILNLSYLSNDKKEKIYLMPSTIYYLRRNQLLLIDDGKNIKILINDNVNKEILNHYFINYHLKEKNELNDIEFFCENNYLKNIISNKPIIIEYINEDNISNINILNNFIEDSSLLSLNQIIETNSFEYMNYYEYFFKIYSKVSSELYNI